LSFIGSLMGLTFFFFALAGLCLLSGRGRALAFGLWVGYALFGLMVPQLIHTHDYYNLPLIPIVALSISSIGNLTLSKLTKEKRSWQVLFVVIALGGLGFQALKARGALLAKDYRNEPKPWIKMGEALPKDGNIIALTHEYGYRLLYYGWRQVSLWPYTSDFDLTIARGGNVETNFELFFAQMTGDKDYFLVTLYSELESQPALKSKLYDNYPIYDEGDGYILFDLHGEQ